MDSSNDGANDGAPTVIRVIEVRRDLADVLTTSPEKLELMFNTATLQKAVERESFDGFLNLAARLQTPLGALLVGALIGAPRSRTSMDEQLDTLDSVLVRELLAICSYLRPILIGRESDEAVVENSQFSEANSSGAPIRTRLSDRTRAVGIRGADVAVAAEEPVLLGGVVADPGIAGLAIVEMLGSGRPAWEDSEIESGATGVAMLAALGPIHIPIAIPEESGDQKSSKNQAFTQRLLKRGLIVVPFGSLRETAVALQLQARTAASFYFGGAAAAVTLSRAWAERNTKQQAADINIFGKRSGVVVSLSEPSKLGDTSWRDSNSQDALRYFLERLSKTALIAAKVPGMWTFDLTPLYELYAQGAFSTYLRVLVEGRDSEFLEEFLELSAIRSAKAILATGLAREAARSASRARLYMMIVEDKFGSKRASAALETLRVATGARARGAPGAALARLSDSIQIDDPEAVLAILTKKERELVETTYANRLKEWDTTISNKCPHVRLARRLRAAPTAADALSAMRDLEKLLASPNNTDAWLMCRNCELRALCPHARERVRLEAARAPYSEIRTQLMKYSMKVQSGDNMYNYYCRICSERLAEFIEEDRSADAGRFGSLDSGLRTKIWATAMNAARFVRFPAPTDERQFSNTVAAAVFTPLMLASENSAKRGRRRDDAELVDSDGEVASPRVQLDIILFVYAFILDLTQTTAALRGREIGFEKVKLGAKASVYAEHILRHVADTHRGLISQIEDVTAEYIAAQFTEAYRLVRGESTSGLPQTSPEEELACQITMNDQVYRFAMSVARVAGDLPIARASGPAAARTEFETIIGMSLPGIVQSARTNARDPALAPLYLRRTGVEVPAGGSLEFLVKDPRIGLYAKLYTPRRAPATALAAFAAFAQKIGGAITKKYSKQKPPAHFKPGKADKPAPAKPATRHSSVLPTRPISPTAEAEIGRYFESYRLLAMYAKDVHNIENYDAYQKELAEYRTCENGLRLAQATAVVKSFYDFEWTKSQRWTASRVGLATLYDEQGRRHKWLGYVYSVGGSPSSQLVKITGGPKAIMKARASGKVTPSMKLVDLICELCHVRLSRCEKDLDATKVQKAVLANGEIGAFYEFYASRCPKGLVHEWSGGSCAKCGLRISVLENAAQGASDAREYYIKFASQFAEERRSEREARAADEVSSSQKIEGPHQDKAAVSHDTERNTEADAWKPDFTLVVRAAAIAGVPPTLIQAIGQTDGREYADVTDGRGVPAPPTSPTDPRIFAADAEARLFLADYNTLRAAGKMRKMPLAIAGLIDSVGVPKHELVAMQQQLPDIGSGYYERLAAMIRRRDAPDVYAFTIQSLCEMVVSVAAATGPHEWIGKLGLAFAKHELSLILRGQKLFAKPGPFNWAIFETDEEGDAFAASDQVGDVGEDIVEPDASVEDNPYSGDALDYDPGELGPNDEPP